MKHFEESACTELAEVLRNPSINRTNSQDSSFACIIKAFQNPVWAEQARERLKQIKLLTRAATA